MERRGELSEEMLMKKRVVNDYFHSRLTGKYDWLSIVLLSSTEMTGIVMSVKCLL